MDRDSTVSCQKCGSAWLSLFLLRMPSALHLLTGSLRYPSSSSQRALMLPCSFFLDEVTVQGFACSFLSFLTASSSKRETSLIPFSAVFTRTCYIVGTQYFPGIGRRFLILTPTTSKWLVPSCLDQNFWTNPIDNPISEGTGKTKTVRSNG